MINFVWRVVWRWTIYRALSATLRGLGCLVGGAVILALAITLAGLAGVFG